MRRASNSWSLAAVAPVLQGLGDVPQRLVFMGDSITQQGLYTAYVEDWLALRYPRADLTCFQVGWAGDTVAGALLRFERDVVPLRPTVVTVCLGMNDAGYATPERKKISEYQSAMRTLLERIQACGAQPVCLTPGMSDDSKQAHFAQVDYNRVGLRAYADATVRVARRALVPIVDLHAVMNAVAASGLHANAAFTLAPDGNHPNAAGHLVMAGALLYALGERPGKELSVTAPSSVGQNDLDLDHHLFAIPSEAQAVIAHLPAEITFAPTVVQARTILQSGTASDTQPDTVDFHQPNGLVHEVAGHVALDPRHGFSSGPGAARILALGAAGRAVWMHGWRAIGLAGHWSFNGGMEAPCDGKALRLAAELATRSATIRRRSPAPCVAFHPQPPMAPMQTVAPGEFIHRWRVSGPFFQPFISDALASVGGEKACARVETALDANVWSRLQIRPGTESDCLGLRLGAHRNCLAYLAADVQSALAQTVEFGIGSDDGFALWLNGVLVGSRLDVMRGATPDSDVLPGRLCRGTNRVLLKISQYASGWGFYLRLRGLAQPVEVSWPTASIT